MHGKEEPDRQNVCPLCGRQLPDDTTVNEHHMVPRSEGGRETVRMHRICHNKIHAVFSERELALYYHTVERLLENEEIRKFVRWVRKKPPAFNDKHLSRLRRR
ncbi:HNH endonuclease [Noviherbaspirillum galbum]|uniref:HNH endonuclease n=1 Tax=Noviherbaspirillum galbum TaxID=2709383 RepID=A0A6B3SI54_9BURK|nr:HNH endonuclease [Noviherbaspirillum galbum]NEX60534.1 HNH endonuclease [Noviherbaspirillum galbum]